MTHLTPFPEETLESLLWRIAKEQGFEAGPKAKRKLLPKTTGTQLIGNLQLAVGLNQLNPEGPSAKDLLWNHTLFPVEAVFDHRLQTLPYYLLSQETLFKSTLWTWWSEETAYTLKACPHCMEEQKKKYSQTYWKRSWFLGGGAYCLEHDCPLLISAKGYPWKAAWDRLFMPEDLEWTEFPVLPEEKVIARGAAAAMKTQEFRKFGWEKWASVVLASEKLSLGPKRRDPIDCFGRYSTKVGTKKNTMRTQFESCWGERMWELEMSKRRPLFCLHNWRQNYLCAQSCFPDLSPEELIALGAEQNRKFEF